MIIDPRTLTIVALVVHGPQVEASPAVLHTEDIREFGELGFIVDDSSKLMELEGLVRLQQIIDFHFDIMRCTVYDKSGKKLGRVNDFSFDPGSYTVQQIYIKESLLKSLTSTSHIIHRSQIVSIDNQKSSLTARPSPHMTNTLPIPEVRSSTHFARQHPNPTKLIRKLLSFVDYTRQRSANIIIAKTMAHEILRKLARVIVFARFFAITFGVRFDRYEQRRQEGINNSPAPLPCLSAPRRALRWLAPLRRLRFSSQNRANSRRQCTLCT